MEMLSGQMTSDQKVFFRNLLEKKRKNLLATEETLRRQDIQPMSFEGAGDITRIKTHPADLATDNQDLALQGALSDRNLHSLQEIEEALDRMDRGGYGECLSCKEAISPKRLEVLPEARFCVECEQDLEEMKHNIGLDRSAKTSVQTLETAKAIESLGQLLVSDIMRDSPISLKPNEGIHQAMTLMSDYGIRHLPVVDSEGDLQGVVSDRDILNAVVRLRPWKLVERMENPWQEVRVSAVMTKVPESINPDTSLTEAGRMMLENKFSALPVVDGNRLVGIITESDFVRLIS
ncbi:MAG: hypothetical protein RJB66_1310 [Pseudomonadota bacterium]|jgi:RNA polymerase-binding protein DksA